MNMRKLITLTGLLFLTGASVFGWGPTPHAVIAYLGYKYASNHTKEIITPLLYENPSLPGDVFCLVSPELENPNAFIASAISSWPDTIKYIPAQEWGPAGKNAQNFYANAHFIDTQFKYGTVATLDTATAMDIVQNQVNTVDGQTKDDLYYVFRSCIKSLALSQDTITRDQISKDEVIFALRHLIHLAGDDTQPLHMSDPMYTQDGTKEDSYGGNEIEFSSPYVITNQYNKQFELTELHELWDYPGNDFVPINNESTQDSGMIIDKESAHIIKNIAHTLDQTYSSQRSDIDNNAGYNTKDLVMSWATEGYIAAVANICSGLDPISQWILTEQPKHLPCRAKLPIDGSPMPTSNNSAVISTPTVDYVNALGPVTTLQMYRASVRLADLLNAIYDPRHAPKVFVDYVNQIKSDKSIPTVNNLEQVYYPRYYDQSEENME